MERLRILHILPSTRGYGAERQVMQILAGMPSIDMISSLLTIYAHDPDGEEPSFATFCADRRGRGDYFFLMRIVRAIRMYRADIVHTHTHVGRYWGRAAAVLAGVRHIVHTEHNPCDKRRTSFERVADGILHRSTERVITFFPEQATHLSKNDDIPRWKIAVIPNGLPLPVAQGVRADARAKIDAGEGRFVIFHVGRMEYQKNQALALDALGAVRPDLRKRVLLCFAGAGENEHTLRERCRELGLDACVRFLGYRNDVRELLAGADLLLMTSWFEGMPLTLMEAMAAGVPVVTTPWTGARTMLGDGIFGFITPGYDAASVAGTVERAADHDNIRNGIAASARAHANSAFDISRTIAAHVELYRELGGLSA